MSSIALTSTTELTITGTNLPSETCEAIVLTALSTSCTVSSNTEVVLVFENGIPTSSKDISMELRFNYTEASHYALVDELTVF